MPFNTSDLTAATETRGELRVNGDLIPLSGDDDVLEVLKRETARRGITTFAAFANGRELNSLEEISSTIDDGEVVEVRTYAKPGHVGRFFVRL